MNRPFIIASRESELAMWQAKFIQNKLEKLYPQHIFKIQGFKTQGDIILDQPLANIGGKGLFIKELEQAMLNGQADLAVHSMKDLPMDLPDGFELAAITEREDPRDAFISNKYNSLELMPKNSIVGTSSLRRQSQIKHYFSDLKVLPLRGNLQTRLQKLDGQQYDAIILAAAGLIRLGLKDRISAFIDKTFSIPAVGQGALGIEILEGNQTLHEMISPLNHHLTAQCVKAERAFSRILAGSCTVPLGAHAYAQGDNIVVQGFVASPSGNRMIKEEVVVPNDQIENAGTLLGQKLISLGAKDILNTIE